jgi:hypothetical protein
VRVRSWNIVSKKVRLIHIFEERERIKIKGPANFAHERRHWSGETFPPAAKLPLNLFLEKKSKEIDLDMTSV